jgi:signal transduction histidine kinase
VALLRAGDFGPVQAQQDEPLNIISRRILMLTKLVDNFTAIQSAELRGLRREEINAADLVQLALADFGAIAQERGLKLVAETGPCPASLSGDIMQLRRVLDNLIGNAVKFTPAGGSITARAWQENGRQIIEVADTGVGIPPEQVARVVERFYQVDGSMTRNYGGTGLGLALVKEIAQAHGGHLTVESALGQGSTFRITLPLN